AVGLVLVVGSAIADELFGVVSKVDVDAKKLTVIEKDSDKEVSISVNDDTEVVTKKGAMKVDLEKLSKGVEKAQDKGAKGINVKITQEKGVASKIEYARKKAAAKADN